MKALAFVLAVVAAACASGASNDAEPASERPEPTEVAAANDGAVVAPEARLPSGAAGGQGAARPPAADVPNAGIRDRPSDPAGDEADQCGASRYQWLVGRPRSAIPAKPSDATWRVTCTSCPVTMDHSSARLNIFYDSETERIEEVRCG